MVISQIIGGLGNQMFQYAAGRALSLSTSQPLLLDLRRFDTYQLHNGYELDAVFNVPARVATVNDIRGLLGWRATRLSLKLLKNINLHFLRGQNLAIEPHFNFWPNLRNVSASSFLMGYWQSEKYFKNYEQIIRTDFIFKRPLDAENLKRLIRMKTTNSVSLHVRRGDYVSNKKNSKLLNVCSLEYYIEAIKILLDKVDSPTFFIFSDDLEWARAKIKIPFSIEYVINNDKENSYLDMQLMSICKHNIIANSTFSWWGAWLNTNPSKVVIAPKRWFMGSINDQDLIPEDWIRV